MSTAKRRKKIKKNCRFVDDKDIKQFTEIKKHLKRIINFIPDSIIAEISEYCTGLLIKCPGEYPTRNCSGAIHYLHGNNFHSDIDFTIRYCSNKWTLFDYECDEIECDQITHIFNCCNADCDDSICIIDEDSIRCNQVCELVSQCKQIYCEQHCEELCNCSVCGKYFCSHCVDKICHKCEECQEWECMHHSQQDGIFYCDICRI